MAVPPLAPGALPVVGHIEKLVRDPLTWLRRCSTAGPVLRLAVGCRPLYLVCDGDLALQMLINRDGVFDKGGPFFEAARAAAPNSLTTCPAHQHKRQRSLMQPALSPRSVAEAEQVMAVQAELASASWHDGQELDVCAETGRMAYRVMASVLMPSVTDVIDVDHLRGVINELTRVGVLQVVIPRSIRRILPTVDRKYADAITATHRAAEHIMQISRGQGASGEGLLGVLAAGTGDGNGQVEDELLRDEIITLLAAGTETTSSTLAWVMHMLSIRPDLQERLHAEVDRLPPGPVTVKGQLCDLTFTANMVSETLRCYPSNWLLSRSNVRPTTLGGYDFPIDTAFLFSPYQIHRDPRNFTDPMRFDPDRWDGRLPTTLRPGYLPFGAGARGCIGDRFAVSEIVNLLVSITRRWHLAPVPHNKIDTRRPKVFATPVGLRLRVAARTDRLAATGQ